MKSLSPETASVRRSFPAFVHCQHLILTNPDKNHPALGSVCHIVSHGISEGAEKDVFETFVMSINLLVIFFKNQNTSISRGSDVNFQFLYWNLV